MPKNRNRQGNRIAISDFWGSNEYATQQSAVSRNQRLPVRRQVRRQVDTFLLRRAFMLQNFQFILRADLLCVTADQALPQGQRKLIECLHSYDNLVPWEAVHSVVMRTTPDDFECPICMSTPVAPRITECGHLFCLPCIMQYLSLRKASNHQRLCPICNSAVAGFTLRPCVLQVICPVKVGNIVRFDLFRRERYECTLHRYDDPRMMSSGLVQTENRDANRTNVTQDELGLPNYIAPYSSQCRYVLATHDYESRQRSMDGIEISDRLKEMDKILTHPLTESDATTMRFLIGALDETMKQQKGLSPSLARESPPMAPRPYGSGNTPLSRPKENDHKVFELYAESDGQPYYLHMITMKMLRHDAKLRNAPLPESVSGPVDEITSFVQDEEMRRIYKVFAHVPLHATINLCLLDLSKVVCPETMREFEPVLSELARRRLQKASDEARAMDDDTSWNQYLQTYIKERPSSALPSDYCSHDTDSIPFLRLPSTESGWSDHGLLPSTLDTRQRATKKQESDNIARATTDASGGCTSLRTNPTSSPDSFTSCWGSGSGARLLISTLKTLGTSTMPTTSICSEHEPSSGGIAEQKHE
ncbi:unnamed protein product [Phytomonas sp. EM1]|nr:unnamed protein product [Phytomonas sp. EM1]|eukprot:CCW60262.1 unnamed protein product [Phytomonas sp. isolate EM1]